MRLCLFTLFPPFLVVKLYLLACLCRQIIWTLKEEKWVGLSFNFVKLCSDSRIVVTEHLELSLECTEAKTTLHSVDFNCSFFFLMGDGNKLILLKCIYCTCQVILAFQRFTKTKTFCDKTMQCLYPDIMVKYKVKHSVHLVPVVRLVLNYLNDVALSVRPVEIK